MHLSAPRLRRGTSVIAALIFAAILGGIALGLNAVHPKNPQSITAAAADAADAGSNPNALTPANGADSTGLVGYTGSCDAVIQAAAQQGHESEFSPVTDTQDNLKDSCDAAVFKTGADLQAVQKADPSNWQHDPNAYQCVGKSGQLVDNKNGTFTESMQGDASVAAGKCNTQVCDLSGKCSATQLVAGVSALGSAGAGSPFSGLDNGSPTVSSNDTLPAACQQNSTSYACTSALLAQNSGTAGQPGTELPACVGDQNSVECQAARAQAGTTPTPANPFPNPSSPTPGSNTPPPSTPPSQLPSGPCPTGQPVNAQGVCTLSVTHQTEYTCPNGGMSPNCGVGGNNGGNVGGIGGGLGSFLTGFMHGATFGAGNPSMMGGYPGQQQCSFIGSLLGCQNATVSCQISMSPNPPQQGMPASLTWTTSGNVGFAMIPGIGQVGPSGTYTIYPNMGTNYTLQIQDQSGNQSSCSTQGGIIPRTGCAGNTSCVSPQTPYGVGTNGQACAQPPAQPDPSQCTVGSWQSTSASGNGCTTGYQCVPNNSNGNAAPTAQLSCSPQTVEVGQSVAFAYSCGGGSTTASSSAFTTTGLSGTATLVVPQPPANTNTATYHLACTNAQGQTAGAQCSVQINQPSIVLVANPARVPSGQSTTIGWVTAGMQSCVVSSPTDGSFTSQNASNESVSGMATTSPITGTTEYDLSCTSIGGQTKIASTTVQVGSSAISENVQVTSSADAQTVNHGSTVTIQWQSKNAPSDSAVALWLVDLRTQAASALIVGQQSLGGSYQWTIPATGSSCDTSSPIACASDLVAGSSYGIEASVYHPANAFLGGTQVPSGAVSPSYTDSGYTPNPFSIGQ